MNSLAEFIHGEDLPATWQKSRLGNLGELYSGATPARSIGARLFGGSIPWVKTGDLNNSHLLTTEETLSDEGFDSCSCRLFPEESVLIAMYGGFGQIGRTGLLGVKATTNQAISALICSRAKAHPEYVLHWLNAYRFLWREYAGSSRKDPNITKSDIHAFPIALPPLPEQQKIADILGTWDEALEKHDALIATKARRKQALMQQLLTGHRRLPGFSKPWKQNRFGDLMESEDRYADFDDDHLYHLVSARRRAEGVFFREALHGRDIKTKVMKQVRSGDFVISRMQVVHGGLGVVPPECDGYFASDSYEVLVPRDPAKLSPRFIGHLCRTRRFWHHALVCSHGVHIEKMTFVMADFKHEKFKIPEFAEQIAIANILDTADAELRLLRQQRTALDHQKRGLMQQLLTGTVRVSI